MSFEPKLTGAELKAAWLQALRSGEYKQADNVLCRDGKFCCLGVLAHITGVPHAPIEDGGVDYFDFGPLTGRFTQIPPAGFYRQIGLPALINKAPGWDQSLESLLVGMNDEGHSFTKIADAIEAELKV